MQTQGYNLLDTSKFDAFINARASLISEYNDINQRFSSIVQNLSNNHWRGQGADAFADDAQQVRTNINGIQDILRTMCDTLIDCRTVFGECDSALRNANESAAQVN
jgi:uncharacterized protein YukE